MSTWAPLPRDDELERADELLDQADALLRRHRGAEQGAARPRAALDDEDLPILTDVVDDLELVQEPATAGAQSPGATEPASAPAAERAAAAAPIRPGEAQKDLEQALLREVESWITSEMPRILARELDQLGERLREEMLAHLQSTLAPRLSGRQAADLRSGEDPTQAPGPSR